MNKKGITLIELLIATTLISFVVLGAAGIYLAGINFFSSIRIQGELQNKARLVLEHMFKYMRKQSYAATISDSNRQINVETDPDGTTGFAYKWVDTDSPADGIRDAIQFCPDTPTGWCASPETIAKDITNLGFTGSYPLITITITASKREQTFTLTSALRI